MLNLLRLKATRSKVMNGVKNELTVFCRSRNLKLTLKCFLVIKLETGNSRLHFTDELNRLLLPVLGAEGYKSPLKMLLAHSIGRRVCSLTVLRQR